MLVLAKIGIILLHAILFITPIVFWYRVKSFFVIVILYGFIIFSFILSWKTITTKSTFSENDNKNRNELNLIEFLNKHDSLVKNKEWWESTSTLPEQVAFTNTDVNFRVGDGTNYSIIETIPKGEKVVLRSYRKGDWFEIGYNGKIGWVNGQYLRPSKKADKVLIIASVNFLKIIFPENTIFKKILAVLFSIPISIIVNLVLMYILGKDFSFSIFRNFDIDIDMITLIVPFVYLMSKSKIIFNYSMQELSILLWVYLILSYFLSIASNYVSKIIADRINI